MKVYFRIKPLDGNVATQTFSKSVVTFNVSELDFIDIELEFEEYVESDRLLVLIGNTPFLLDEPRYRNNLYYYNLNLLHIKAQLPGGPEAHISETVQVMSEYRRFSRLFINEIGLSKIYVRTYDQEEHVASVIVETNKLSNENYELITLYLISAGYFDSNIIYKAVLEGQQDEVRNSLLEALRELERRLKLWESRLFNFAIDPITKYSTINSIVDYSVATDLDDLSIEWLVENPDMLQRVTSSNADVLLNNISLKVSSILTSELKRSTDAYENRVILGFILNLKRLLNQLSIEVQVSSPRSRIRHFKDFLIKCFNDLIERYIQSSRQFLDEIQLVLQGKLNVASPIFGFPTKVDGFVRKPHYLEVLQLMDFSRKLFNINLDVNHFSLEVESFDKLFEIYCFYLIKDSISTKFPALEWHAGLRTGTDNKLAGKYSLQFDDLLIRVYYEDLPDTFVQVSKSKYPYNPDFVIEAQRSGKSVYVILDAKYKKYDSARLQEDLAKLTLNYLHKIRIQHEHNGELIGLFTISLSSMSNSHINSIFKNEFGMFAGAKPVHRPQIGSIEIMPKYLSLETNPILAVLRFMLEIV